MQCFLCRSRKTEEIVRYGCERQDYGRDDVHLDWQIFLVLKEEAKQNKQAVPTTAHHNPAIFKSMAKRAIEKQAQKPAYVPMERQGKLALALQAISIFKLRKASITISDSIVRYLGTKIEEAEKTRDNSK